MRTLAIPLLLLLGCTNKPAEPAQAKPTEPTAAAQPTEPAPAQAAAQPTEPAQAPGPEVGADAPDFSLVGSDGKTHSLAELRGKQAVVLAWFPKAFTGGCTVECKSLTESSESLRKFDTAYFAVSTDTAEDNKRFAQELGADYPILSDPSGDTARAYGVIGKDGVHAKRWTYYIGVDGKILHIDREVKPATAGQDVVARAEELKFAKRAP